MNEYPYVWAQAHRQLSESNARIMNIQKNANSLRKKVLFFAKFCERGKVNALGLHFVAAFAFFSLVFVFLDNLRCVTKCKHKFHLAKSAAAEKETEEIKT